MKIIRDGLFYARERGKRANKSENARDKNAKLNGNFVYGVRLINAPSARVGAFIR